ncbi:MAG: prolyl oligopeptidase family serine peptidase, partial [Silvibacterium sp.]
TEDGRECRTIIPEQETAIQQLVIAGEKAFSRYLNNLVPAIRCWSLEGREGAGIDIPPHGTVQMLPNHSDESVVFYSYESFTEPPAIFEYRPNSGVSNIWHQRLVAPKRDSVSVEHAMYLSADRTSVPITLVRKRNNPERSMSPAIMTSYGGFGVPSTPQFSVLVSIMIEFGAVFALPHIRGGGEFGKQWHEAGRGRHRQSSFDDFISAAVWLCSECITSPSKLAIFGGSNSGLLVGAAMTQRPDLFRAILCIAPLLDMVRYELFDQAARWKQEYGTVDNPEDFRALYAYSPYHHVDDGADYPATLFVSGDKDERCNPAHVRKMAASLQDRSAQRNSIVVDYSGQRGHSPVMPLSVRVEAVARRIAFLCRELRLSLPADAPL